MDAIQRALELSHAQLSAIKAGDEEAFLGGLDELEASCQEAVAGLHAGSDRARFTELAAINEQIAVEVAHVRDATRARLAALRHAHLSATAYLATSAPSPLAIRDA